MYTQLDCLTGIHQPSMQYSVQIDMFKKSKEKPSSVFDKTKTAKFRENKGFVHSGPAPYFPQFGTLGFLRLRLKQVSISQSVIYQRNGDQLFQSQYITPKQCKKIKRAITAVSDRPSFLCTEQWGSSVSNLWCMISHALKQS